MGLGGLNEAGECVPQMITARQGSERAVEQGSITKMAKNKKNLSGLAITPFGEMENSRNLAKSWPSLHLLLENSPALMVIENELPTPPTVSHQLDKHKFGIEIS